MITPVQLTDSFKVSPIIHGHWRLNDWALSQQELLSFVMQTMELGVTTLDHADIYGNYTCEKLFGDALALKPSLRNELQLITKCGIKLLSDKYPSRTVKYYDYSYDYIISSVNNSLSNLSTDYIDLLLLHRPSPFFDPEEVAKAFSYLHQSGKVLHFGVSNFSTEQFTFLNTQLDQKLVTNQIEVSPLCLENFKNGHLDFLKQNGIKPLSWSPLAGGNIFNPKDNQGFRVLECLRNIAKELNVQKIDQIVYKWIMMHPSSIIPIIGTGNISRVENAVKAIEIELSLEQWFKIYIASEGKELP